MLLRIFWSWLNVSVVMLSMSGVSLPWPGTGEKTSGWCTEPRFIGEKFSNGNDSKEDTTVETIGIFQPSCPSGGLSGNLLTGKAVLGLLGVS